MIDALIQYLFFPLFFGTFCLAASAILWSLFSAMTNFEEEYKENGKVKIDLKKIIFVYLLGALVTGLISATPFS